jgi:hypothetical protein
MGAASAGEAIRQAFTQFAGSIPSSPQPSDAGIDMPILSHGMSVDCAHALTAGPKASQNAKTAARMGCPFKRFSG